MVRISNIKSIEKASLIYGAILALIFCLSLYIRVALPYNSVFGGPFVRFSGNDPWYNMRLVENTLHNFPERIFFDAFTYYPHGTIVPFAPLFDYLLAVIIWILGLGHPYATLGQHGIEVIGAWYPAVLGAFTVIPVYFIGKELWNRNAGLLSAALIAVLPGQFLTRSLLGFTDHHVAETLFSTIAMLFLIIAIKRVKEKGITFHSFMERDWTTLKASAIYLFLAGFSLGLYYLAWKGAPLFVFILLIYAVVQYTIDHVRGKSTDYLCIIAIPLFIIPLIMLAPIPVFNSPTRIQVLSLILGLLVFVVLSILSSIMNYRGIKPYGYPIAILILAVVSFSLLNVLAHPLYSMMVSQLHIFTPSESALTVAEIHPMHIFSRYTGRITQGEAYQYFTTCFFAAFAGFAWLGYNIARRFRAEEVLFMVWSAVMLYACFGQNRFAYYYAVNVALLCGLVAWAVIEFVAFGSRVELVSEKAKTTKKGKKGGTSVVTQRKAKTKATNKAKEPQAQNKHEHKKIAEYLRTDVIIASFIIGLILFYPPLSASLAKAKYAGDPPYDWYESLTWMRKNTPEPGISYYELYQMPEINKTTGRIEDYNYPPEAYGVISWWDYGHWITRIAHRIPIANPFQQGIGGPHKGDKPGACVFFVTTDEARANEVADALDVRYAVSDYMMADAWGSYYNKYTAMTVWAGDPQRFGALSYYYHTLEARLHIFDGTSVDVDGENISALNHYRLVHESPTFYLPLVIMNATTGGGYWRSISGDYNSTATQARKLHGQLFSLPTGMGIEDALDNGTIPAIVKNSLNTTPLALSEDSMVTKRGENWVIRDNTKKNIFLIKKRSGYLDVYLYGVPTGQPGIRAWTPEYINPVSYIKVFEYVKGAKIEGVAPDGSIVEVATNVTTNQGRRFVYYNRTIANSNGSYSFIVPYSTEGPIENGTNFDVLASTYKLRAGHIENGAPVWDVEKAVHVPEEAVMNGKTINVDLTR